MSFEVGILGGELRFVGAPPITQITHQLDPMAQQLAAIFGELGISQYLDAFVEQGFDTWDTILDITESDL